MSDETRELIAEVRHRRAYSVYGEGTAYEDIGRLCDALEATLQPVESEFKYSWTGSPLHSDSKRKRSVDIDALADVIKTVLEHTENSDIGYRHSLTGLNKELTTAIAEWMEGQ